MRCIDRPDMPNLAYEKLTSRLQTVRTIRYVASILPDCLQASCLT